MCSRTPADVRLEVKPRKIMQRVLARKAGSTWSGSVAGPTGSSLSRQLIWVRQGLGRRGRAGGEEVGRGGMWDAVSGCSMRVEARRTAQRSWE